MCGIAVVINKKNEQVNKELLWKMTNLVQHRGPDGSGIYIDGPVGLGHRRLSIIDLSECGKQPMFFEDLSLTYNGEIYNYIELREELKAVGYEFVSTSDSEVLLKAYHCWGKECVHKMRGMWAFAIYDKKNGVVFLSRDRFGIKPLHYTNTNNQFLAGSEIKEFTAFPDFEPRMFHPVVFEFLEHGVLNHNEYTFYDGVFSLKGGHNLTYTIADHKIRIEQWYDLKEKTKPKKIKLEEAGKLFRQQFEEAVKIHLRSDVKLGSCLSGGLDSSSIVSISRKILGDDMRIFTVTSCNKEARYDEQEYANVVVDHAKTDAILTYPNLDELYSEQLLEKITWHHDQPIPTGSHFSEYAVFEAARKNDLIVMLDGQGSDEYMAGYHEFFMMRCLGLFKKGRFGKLHVAVKNRAKNRGLSEKGIYLTLLKMLIKKGKQAAGVQFTEATWAEKQKHSGYTTYKGNDSAGSLYELSLLEIKETSIPYQLHSEDRNAMLFSIESRVPFLDHVLVESMMNLPEDDYFQDALDKAPIREGLKGILPGKIYNRKTKLGFVSSDDLWMKENAPEVRSRLEWGVNYFKGIIKPSVLSDFDAYVSGSKNFNNIFFRVLSLYAWAKATGVRITETTTKSQ